MAGLILVVEISKITLAGYPFKFLKLIIYFIVIVVVRALMVRDKFKTSIYYI